MCYLKLAGPDLLLLRCVQYIVSGSCFHKPLELLHSTFDILNSSRMRVIYTELLETAEETKTQTCKQEYGSAVIECSKMF